MPMYLKIRILCFIQKMRFCMNGEEVKQLELINELNDLKNKYNSLKELFEKEVSQLKIEGDNIRKSEEKFRIAYITSPDSININRLSDGMYVSINEGFTNIMGYSESESIGRTSLEMNIWLNQKDREYMVKVSHIFLQW